MTMLGVIFDLDGTLMDSMDSWSAMWEDLVDEFHLTRPARFTQDITPLGAVGTAKYMQKLGLNMEVDDIIAMFRDRIQNAYKDDILPKPGVPAYLERLHRRGIPMCILTATPRAIVLPCLERNGLSKYFSFVSSCDDVHMPKGNPQIYALTIDRLGTTMENTVFFDDNLEALTAGHTAGLYTVGVFDKSSEADRPQIEAITDRYITSFEELL